MTVELGAVIALPFVLTAFGVSVGLSLLAAGITGIVLTTGAGTLAHLVGNAVTSTFESFVLVAAILLIVVGALLEFVGAVLGLPDRPERRREDPDRAAFVSGGALGVPLPVAASLIFVAIMLEISVTKLTIAALLPGLVLSALYLLLFGLSRLVRTRPLELGAEADGDGKVLAIVFRCVVPVAGALIFIVSTQAGVLTPAEAAGLVVVAGLIFALPLILVSRRARGGAWPGVSAGVSGAANFLLILLGLVILARVLMNAGLTAEIGKAIAPLGLDGRGLLGILAIAGLIAGLVLGPLAAVGLVGLLSFATVSAAGVDRLVFGVTLFLAAEAVRVGPRLWRGGFLREGPGGGLGSWPNYLAAVAVTAGYIVLLG